MDASEKLIKNQRLSELKFDELPDIPKIWIDFLNAALPILPARSEMHALAEKAELVKKQSIQRGDLSRFFIDSHSQRSSKASENIRLLGQPESVVVIASLYTGLFGGVAFQILKCLTAIKVCDELARHAITAVPVAWINSVSSPQPSAFAVNLLDGESELHRLQLEQPAADAYATNVPLTLSQIASPLNQIEAIGRDIYDYEIIELLRSTFRPGTTIARAAGQLFASLMEEWGMLVVDPSSTEMQSILPKFDSGQVVPGDAHKKYPIQSSVLPVIACIIDPDEVASFISAQPFFNRNGLVQPLVWPRASATVMDARSRRMLERYHLELNQLFSGEQAVTGNLMSAMPPAALEKLDSLKAEIGARIDALKTLNSSEKELGRAVDSSREKILFQIDKLAQQFETARKSRSETARRQIHKACNFLAPNGKLQESELAAIQLPLRYSRSILRSLYEKLDILNSEHQIISVD